MAFVDIELQAGESGIELAAELRRQGVPCVFATGQPGRAREHGGLALGLVEKPYNPMAIVEVVRYFEALRAGQRPARLPWGLELFGPNASPVPDRLSDTPAPTVVPCATAGSLGPSAAAISAGIAPRTDQGPADSGVLEALAG